MKTKSSLPRLSLITVGIPLKITAEQFVVLCTDVSSARDLTACSDQLLGRMVRAHLDALGAIADTYGCVPHLTAHWNQRSNCTWRPGRAPAHLDQRFDERPNRS